MEANYVMYVGMKWRFAVAVPLELAELTSIPKDASGGGGQWDPSIDTTRARLPDARGAAARSAGATRERAVRRGVHCLVTPVSCWSMADLSTLLLTSASRDRDLDEAVERRVAALLDARLEQQRAQLEADFAARLDSYRTAAERQAAERLAAERSTELDTLRAQLVYILCLFLTLNYYSVQSRKFRIPDLYLGNLLRTVIYLRNCA